MKYKEIFIEYTMNQRNSIMLSVNRSGLSYINPAYSRATSLEFFSMFSTFGHAHINSLCFDQWFISLLIKRILYPTYMLSSVSYFFICQLTLFSFIDYEFGSRLFDRMMNCYIFFVRIVNSQSMLHAFNPRIRSSDSIPMRTSFYRLASVTYFSNSNQNKRGGPI